MGYHSVIVNQIRSEYPGDAGFNVFSEIGSICISSMDIDSTPTYLVQIDQHHFQVIQFDNEQFAREWYAERSENISSMRRIKDLYFK